MSQPANTDIFSLHDDEELSLMRMHIGLDLYQQPTKEMLLLNTQIHLQTLNCRSKKTDFDSVGDGDGTLSGVYTTREEQIVLEKERKSLETLLLMGLFQESSSQTFVSWLDDLQEIWAAIQTRSWCWDALGVFIFGRCALMKTQLRQVLRFSILLWKDSLAMNNEMTNQKPIPARGISQATDQEVIVLFTPPFFQQLNPATPGLVRSYPFLLATNVLRLYDDGL
ncbi:hypothetical protein Tco_1532426 [Tanacetum coccineum]